MTNVTITITTREGVTTWIPGRKHSKDGRWRLIPKNGKGTRPAPKRLMNQARKARGK